MWKRVLANEQEDYRCPCARCNDVLRDHPWGDDHCGAVTLTNGVDGLSTSVGSSLPLQLCGCNLWLCALSRCRRSSSAVCLTFDGKSKSCTRDSGRHMRNIKNGHASFFPRSFDVCCQDRIDFIATLWYQTCIMRIPSVKKLRTALQISQKEMADLLGVSKKAVQSYEQGWRHTPPHVEQMVLLHTILHQGPPLEKEPPCWKQTSCKQSVCATCPAFRLSGAGFCWLVTGTLCRGERMGSWDAKRKRCVQCKVLKRLLGRGKL